MCALGARLYVYLLRNPLTLKAASSASSKEDFTVFVFTLLLLPACIFYDSLAMCIN